MLHTPLSSVCTSKPTITPQQTMLMWWSIRMQAFATSYWTSCITNGSFRPPHYKHCSAGQAQSAALQLASTNICQAMTMTGAMHILRRVITRKVIAVSVRALPHINQPSTIQIWTSNTPALTEPSVGAFLRNRAGSHCRNADHDPL